MKGAVQCGSELSSFARSNLRAAVATVLVIGAISISAGSTYAQEAQGRPNDLDTIVVTGSRLDLARFMGQDSGWIANSTYNPSWLIAPYTPPTAGSSSDLSMGDCKAGVPTVIGNPINFSSGAKIEEELDIATHEEEMPFFLKRTYSSNRFSNIVTGGIFGGVWRSTFDQSLVAEGNSIQWTDSNIMDHTFTRVGTTNRYNSDTGSVDYALANADGTFSVYTADGLVQKFALQVTGSSYGVPLPLASITNKNGVGWFFGYGYVNAWPWKQLLTVTHSSGKQISISWQGGVVSTVTDPAGNIYTYDYTSEYEGKKLANVYLPGGGHVHYLYSGWSLIGKEINSVRYSYFDYQNASWQEYDPSNDTYFTKHRLLAVSTEHGGSIDRNSFQYFLDTTTNLGNIEKVVETNPLGKLVTYEFYDGKLTKITGHPTASCLAGIKEITYDENGNRDLVVREDGVATDYDYNSSGQLVKVTDAVGTEFARVRTFA